MKEIVTILTSEYSILSAIPISRLDSTNLSIQLSDYNYEDYKFIVSEPNHDIATKHISKFVTYGDIVTKMKRDVGIHEILEELKKLKGEKSDNRPTELSDYGATIYANTEYPYIMSSLTETANGNLCSVGGYSLSDGMQTVFDRHVFSSICAEFMDVDVLCANNVFTENLNIDNIHVKNLSAEIISANTICALEIYGTSSYFEHLSVSTIIISGDEICPLIYRGKGNYVDVSTVYDISAETDIIAPGHEGWVYQVSSFEDLSDVQLFSDGCVWKMFGPRPSSFSELSNTISTLVEMQISVQLSNALCIHLSDYLPQEEWTFEYEDTDGTTKSMTKIIYSRDKAT